jgi:hypothetical protein
MRTMTIEDHGGYSILVRTITGQIGVGGAV